MGDLTRALGMTRTPSSYLGKSVVKLRSVMTMRTENCHHAEEHHQSSSYWGLSTCWEVSSWRVWLGRNRKNIASVITLHTKSLPLSILLPLSIAVKRQTLSLVHGQCHAFGKSVVKGTKLQIFTFSPTFYLCSSVERDIAAIWTMIKLPLPKLLSLSSVGPSLSVYLACNEDADSSGCHFKRNCKIQWLPNLLITQCENRRVCYESKGRVPMQAYYLWRQINANTLLLPSSLSLLTHECEPLKLESWAEVV